MGKIKTYQQFNEGIIDFLRPIGYSFANADAKLIMFAIHAIKAGQVKVKETGGGRAPFTKRNYYIFHFDFNEKHISLEKSTDSNIFDSKIKVYISNLDRTNKKEADIESSLKKELYKILNQNELQPFKATDLPPGHVFIK